MKKYNTPKYVYYDKVYQIYRVLIRVRGKRVDCGRYFSQEAAIKARDKALIVYGVDMDKTNDSAVKVESDRLIRINVITDRICYDIDELIADLKKRHVKKILSMKKELIKLSKKYY